MPAAGSLFTTAERKALIEFLVIEKTDRMFGDGQERDYVLDGFPSWPGLSGMTDVELLVELGHHEEGDSAVRMAEAWRVEMRGDA